jgi:pimeloyl-[acyl-carrier protein] synthase
MTGTATARSLPLTSGEFWGRNPHEDLAWARRHDPVHFDEAGGVWGLTRYDDVLTVLLKYSAARTPTPEKLEEMGLAQIGPIAKVMVKQMLFMDAPAHSRLRSLASSAFMPARVAVLRDRIQSVAESLIRKMEGRDTVDIIADFAEPLPAIVTASMLGVPESDWNQLKTWSASFAEMLGNFQHNPERAQHVLKTVESLVQYFKDAVGEQRRRPSAGLVHDLLVAEVNGDRLSDEEVIANSIVTMVGGQETTTNLIGNGLLALLRHPGQMARLRGDPSLMPSAVEELLRFESPSQQTARLAPEDTELGGKRIRAGQAVIAVMAAGNRDPRRFPDPDRLDLGRTDNRHLAFGWAAHFCFGAPLARLEGQIGFEILLRHFPRISLQPVHLQWRHNLGLRGLVSLPVRMETAA